MKIIHISKSQTVERIEQPNTAPPAGNEPVYLYDAGILIQSTQTVGYLTTQKMQKFDNVLNGIFYGFLAD